MTTGGKSPAGALVDVFLQSGQSEMEVVFATEDVDVKPGDNARFISVPQWTPIRMYQTIYQYLKKSGLLKHKVWIKKQGTSVFLYRQNPDDK